MLKVLSNDSRLNLSVNTSENALTPPIANTFPKRIKPYLLPPTPSNKPAKPLYENLLHRVASASGSISNGSKSDAAMNDSLLEEAREYLEDKLALVEPMSSDFPVSVDNLEVWMELNNHRVRVLYQRYLTARKEGAPRRLFPTKSHALHFLQAVAPTKLVDGAWLYGMVNLWQDARFVSLIQIYLEELGEGNAKLNHVLLYKKLLAEHDCTQWNELEDEYFTQGTIQLALGLNAEQFIPEVIGFNLGYEQLPLHLLITAYELKELGISPYYFTLHVTIDNIATGHARKSLQALMDNLPLGTSVATQQEFLRRVSNGYKLNQLGLSTNSIISNFNLENEVTRIFKAKSYYGKDAHADRCRIGGKSINEWLADPKLMPEFISCLIQNGWIKKNEPPANSRFWKLIESNPDEASKAKMFGVFSGYEKQVIYDWIAGNYPTGTKESNEAIGSRQPTEIDEKLSKTLRDDAQLKVVNDPQVAALEKQLASIDSFKEIMQLLSQHLSPTLHHTPAGLLATQLFSKMMYKTYDTSVMGRSSI